MKVLVLRIAGVFFFFALSLFLTNFFDPEIVGKYDFARASLLVLGGICMLGTNQAIIYYSGEFTALENMSRLKSVYFKMILIILSIALLFVLVGILVPEQFFNAFFAKADAGELIFKILLALSAFAISLLNIDTLRALKYPLFSELYRNIFRYTPFFLGAVLLYFTGHADWLVEVYLLGFVVLAVFSSLHVYLVFREQRDVPVTEPAISYKNILKRSYPMALSAVTYFLMQSTDIVLLGKFSDFESVAFYAVAVKLAMVTSLALQSVNVIIAPKIAEEFNRDDKLALNQVVRQSTRLIFFLSLPALAILAALTSFFLGFFGQEYIVAKSALLILLLGQLINTLCGPVGVYMNMTGKQNKLQQILFLGFLVNLILNWYLIPEYGMEGAAWATAISMALWNALAVIYTYRKDRIKLFIS